MLAFSLRPMLEADVAAVYRLQVAAYAPPMVEAEALIGARLAAFPDYAWVAEDADGMAAYLVGYPSRLGCLTPLGGGFSAPRTTDCLYLHDLAVSARARGGGVGSRLLHAAWQAAAQASLSHSALVSVQGTRTYWERFGYAVYETLAPEEQDKLAGYVPPCCYMIRRLG